MAALTDGTNTFTSTPATASPWGSIAAAFGVAPTPAKAPAPASPAPAAPAPKTSAPAAPASPAPPPPPPPAPPPPASATPTGTDSGYYSRTSDTGDTTIPAPTPQSAEEIQAAKSKAAQAEINALNAYYADLSADQGVINAKNDRSTAAISTLSGLAGSTEANVAQQETTSKNQQASAKIQHEQAVAIQGILSKIRSDAVTEARQQRLDYNQSVTDSIANRKARAEEATGHIKDLAASGVTIDGLKTTDPTSYAHLLKQYGGDETALKGAFVLNTPKEQIHDTKIEGGKYIISKQNPITGKITVETVDLHLPPNFTKTVDAGNRILAVPDNWDGDPSKLISINKGLTPAEQQKAVGTGTTYTPGENKVVDSWAERIQSGAAKIGDIPASQAGLRNAVTVALTSQGNQLSGKPTTTELGVAAKTTAKDLLDKFNAGKGTSAVGKSGFLGSFGYGLVPGTDRANFVTDFNALKSQLSLEGVKYLKGQGAVSDAERALLASAVTKLSLSQSEDEFKTTLQGIIDKLDGNAPSTPPSSGGKVLTKDGQSFDASALSPEEYQQAIKDGYIAK